MKRAGAAAVVAELPFIHTRSSTQANGPSRGRLLVSFWDDVFAHEGANVLPQPHTSGELAGAQKPALPHAISSPQ